MNDVSRFSEKLKNIINGYVPNKENPVVSPEIYSFKEDLAATYLVNEFVEDRSPVLTRNSKLLIKELKELGED
ncbi:Protein of unknown function [Bacillus cytotoxicus]|nr:Protein of unknown function [Bacillus cytotoxicus]